MSQKNKSNRWLWCTIPLIAIGLIWLISSVIFQLMLGGESSQVSVMITFEYWPYALTNKHIASALFVSYSVSTLLVFGFFAFLFSPKKKKVFGDHRLAKLTDIKEAGLLDNDAKSIFLGRFKKHYVFFSGQEFVMVYAPTRSGKGVSIVIPNLLQFPDSVVCLDIKFENFELTSGFRAQHGQKVFLFAPGSTEYRTHRWNPLSYMSHDRFQRLNDIDRVAHFLLPTPLNTDPMWSSEGRNLLKSLILLVLDLPNVPNTLGEVTRQLRTEKPSQDYFAELIESHAESLDEECIRGLSEYINTPSRTAGGIKKTVTAALNAWTNPLVDAATESNDFDLRQLRKERMTIYLGVSQNDLDTFSTVFSLFVQQLIDVNTQKDDLPARYNAKGKLTTGNPAIKHQCLLLLDEFCSLGKMDTLAKSVSFIAGYNLRLMPIFQSESQLRAVYGDKTAENIMENHAVRVFFKPNRMQQAKALSDELGYTTTTQQSTSRPNSLKGHGSKNISETKRALMLPEEIMTMQDDDQIILARSCPYPIRSKKVAYYQEKTFASRITKPIKIPTIQPTNYPLRGKVKNGSKGNSVNVQSGKLDKLVDSFFETIDNTEK